MWTSVERIQESVHREQLAWIHTAVTHVWHWLPQLVRVLNALSRLINDTCKMLLLISTSILSAKSTGDTVNYTCAEVIRNYFTATTFCCCNLHSFLYSQFPQPFMMNVKHNKGITKCANGITNVKLAYWLSETTSITTLLVKIWASMGLKSVFGYI